jgi:PAS domain S-box-containing protein
MVSRVLTPALRRAPEIVMAIDASGRLLDLNTSAETAFGVRRSETLGLPIAEFVLGIPEFDAGPRVGLGGDYETEAGSVFGRPLRVTGRRADGRRFPGELHLTRNDGDPTRFTAWLKDCSLPEALRSQVSRRAAALTCTERLARAASWEWDPVTDRLAWSENLPRLLGHASARDDNPLDLLRERSHPDDRPEVESALAGSMGAAELSPRDLRVLTADGELRYVQLASTSCSAHPDRRAHVIGVMRDVTDERLAARRIAVRLAVSKALATWTTLDRSAPVVLEAIATGLGCEVATLWLPESDLLVPRVTWTSERLSGSGFERITKRLRLPKGVGLAGSAWQMRRPVDLATLTADRSYHRHDDAAAAGLKTAVAVPAMCGEEVVAVIDLHSADKVQITGQSLQTLTGLGYELGNVLAARRGQLEANPLTPRELEVLGLVAEGLTTWDIADRLIVARSTVKTHLDHIYSKLGVSDRAAAVAYALRRGLIA